MNDRPARLAAGAISLATLLAMIPATISSSAEHGGLLAGIWALLRFFTITTNLLVGIGFGLIALRSREALSPRLLGGLVLAIMLVGVVFNLLLGGLDHATIWDALGDHVHHKVMPLVVPLWWLAFAGHGRLTWRDAFWWALYPLAYCAYIFLRVGLETPGGGIAYPYFFMDADRLGYLRAFANMGAIAVGFVVTGLGVVALDGRLGRRAKGVAG